MEKAKSVVTYDADKNINGYLVELKKNGRRTEAYLTVAYKNAFKGFHLHKIRESNYVCIKGQVDVLLARDGKIEEIALDSLGNNKLNIPINVPTALRNNYSEEAWLINFPDPAYDPLLTDEQVDIDPKDIEEWLKNENR